MDTRNRSVRWIAAALVLTTLASACRVVVVRSAPTTPTAAVNALLDADRAFAAASAKTELVTGITAMLADDAVVPGPGGAFLEGKAAVQSALRADTLNATSRASWAPVRGGISADGMHGFTYGHLTVTRRDGSTVPMKYLAYWVRGDDGWRVAVYRRRPRAAGDVATAMRSPSLPDRIVDITIDERELAEHRRSLAGAEQQFSDESQVIGLGAGFVKFGASDAMNIGGPNAADFTFGNDAIGQAIGGPELGKPSPVSWNAGRVIVASSGDLGVTIGVIRPNENPNNQPGASFFTIWRRAGKGAPWRYVAE